MEVSRLPSQLLVSILTAPQSPPTEAQFDAFARLVFGAGATVRQTANLKRLHFEATTLVIASLKESLVRMLSPATSSEYRLLRSMPDRRTKRLVWQV